MPLQRPFPKRLKTRLHRAAEDHKVSAEAAPQRGRAAPEFNRENQYCPQSPRVPSFLAVGMALCKRQNY